MSSWITTFFFDLARFGFTKLSLLSSSFSWERSTVALRLFAALAHTLDLLLLLLLVFCFFLRAAWSTFVNPGQFVSSCVMGGVFLFVDVEVETYSSYSLMSCLNSGCSISLLLLPLSFLLFFLLTTGAFPFLAAVDGLMSLEDDEEEGRLEVGLEELVVVEEGLSGGGLGKGVFSSGMRRRCGGGD